MASLRTLFGLLLGALLVSGTAMALPMSGTYTIGDGIPADSYTSFTAAVAALTANGVDGPVTFNVEQLTYNGSITIGPIAGASGTNTITFHAAGTVLPLILANAAPAVELHGADFVTFDGIDVRLTVAGMVVQITDDADSNVIRNCTLTGASEANNLDYGVAITGGGNDYNIIDRVTVNRSAYYPVYLAGDSVESGAIFSDTQNEVRNCTLLGGRYGVFLTRQNGSMVHDCDIQPGSSGLSFGDVAGIYFYHTNTLGEFVCGANANKIHNIRGADITCGIAATSGVVEAFNNFVYDFVVTGTATVYGFAMERVDADLRFNSVYIGNVGTTAYGFYQKYFLCDTRLLCNIFQVNEPTAACWGIYRSEGKLVSNYNCVYSPGPGAGFNMGSDSLTNYATLAQWQAATANDSNSVGDNPGFLGLTDLHIRSDYTLLYGAGLDSVRPAIDIDGDGRGSPPAIGADEYTLATMSHNYSVSKWVGWSYSYISGVPVIVRAEIKNFGINNETNVPVVLSYNGVPQDTALVSLIAGEKDTVELGWTPPAISSLEDFGTLEVQAFCPQDTFLQNDSIRAMVRVYISPLSGTFDLGGGANNYATFQDAITALAQRGVNGPVTFNVYPHTYSGSLHFLPVAGASDTNTITFRASHVLDTRPLISGDVNPALALDGADHLTFDGIDITLASNPGGGNAKVVRIQQGADYNTIKNCTVTGLGQTGSGNYGIALGGGGAGGNSYNVFENIRIDRTVYYPVDLLAYPTAPSLGNEVRNCTLIGGKQSVTLTCQSGAVVRNCDIQPGWDAMSMEIMGIYCAPMTTGLWALEPTVAYGNKIHNLRGTNTASGIYTNSGTWSSFRAYNNFVYDFVVTGTKPLYGLRVTGGDAQFFFNSVSIGDVGTTGQGGTHEGINGFYESGATSTVGLINNVFQVLEPTDFCWAISLASGSLYSDHNCVYGTGTGYNMGRTATNYHSLATWQAGGPYDAHSVEGNPGFMSATDLHIWPLSTLLNGAGLDTAGITTDIDGGLRGSPPDIGADEYVFAHSAHDYGVNNWVGWTYQYTAGVPVTIRAEVQNLGTNNETNVPVRLFYHNVQQDQVLLSLTSGTLDTVALHWTPPAHLQFDTLMVQAFCPGDTFAANDKMKASVLVIGPPMSGSYTIGDGTPADSFTSFTAAVTALTVCGVNGPVTFNVEQLTYNESITIGQIAGVSETNTITFRAGGLLPPLISANAATALELHGADFVTFSGIDMTATGGAPGATNRVVWIYFDANNNTIKNCTLTGPGETGNLNYGVEIQYGGNDANVIENVSINRTVYFPIYLTGDFSTTDQANEVRNCTLIGGKQSVTLNHQNGAVVRNCDIQPGYDGAAVGIMGIYCSNTNNQTEGELSTAYGNKIHNIRGTVNTSAILADPGAGGLFSAYDNFIYDFEVTGAAIVYGLRAASGDVQFYFNSVRIGDVGTTGNTYGFHEAGNGTTVVLKNNIFQIDEPTTACWGIYRKAGTLTASDYNCVYSAGPGALYSMGGDTVNNYVTLAVWQGSTQNDANSVEGNPSFVSATDLHINPLFSLVDSAGTPVEGITNDFDGNVRNATFPDIGADEYTHLLPPAAVQGLTAYPVPGTNNVQLRWPAAAGASSYKIYRSPGFGIADTYVDQTASTTYIHVGAVTLGAKMFYVVVASTDHIAP
jgi:trimeric autotransporter adhesin